MKINQIFYKSLNFLRLTNNKVVNLFSLFYNIIFNYSMSKCLVILSFLIKMSIFFAILTVKILSNLSFNKIFKIKFTRQYILKLFYNYLYLKKIFVLQELILKKLRGIDYKLNKKQIKLIKKERFKKRLIKHIEKTRRIKLKKIQKYMIRRKIRRKKKINQKIKTSRFVISNKLFEFLKIEDETLTFANNISNNIILILFKMTVILKNCSRILKVFKKNKEINVTINFIEQFLNKFVNFTKYFDVISEKFELINKLNKLLKFLVLRKFLKKRSGKKSGKLYFKAFHKYYLFNSMMLLFAFIKVLVISNLIVDNKKIEKFIEKLDIFLNLDKYINQFVTNIKFI